MGGKISFRPRDRKKVELKSINESADPTGKKRNREGGGYGQIGYRANIGQYPWIS